MNQTKPSIQRADSFNTAYLATRQNRDQAEKDKLLAELDSKISSQVPSPSAAPTQPPATQKKEPSPSIVSEGLKAVGGGAVDAVRNTWNAIDDAATWLDNNLLDLRIGSSSFGTVGGAKKSLSGQITGGHKESLQVPELPEWAQNKTTVGNIGRSLAQFVVPFLGATKALKMAGVANAAVRGGAAGMATDFSAFDPNEKRLSNLVLEMTDGNPSIGKPVFDYLAASPEDTHIEGRLKNTLEGLGIGIAAEGIMKGLKATKAHFSSKGKNAAQAVQEVKNAPVEDLTAHAVDTAKAPDMALADQIDLITGVKKPDINKFQKKLDVQAAVKASDAEAAQAAKPKELELAEGPLQSAPKESNPDAFLKGSNEVRLEDPSAIPYEASKEAPAAPSFPDTWKLVEEDTAGRKMFLDPEDGHIHMAAEAGGPHQLDLDMHLPEVIKKAEHTPEEKTMLEGYKELQEKVLKDMPAEAPAEPIKASKDIPLEDRIAKAQERVEALEEAGKDASAAQKLLDSLLRKKDEGLFDGASKLTSRQAESLASVGDPLVDAIAANNEKLLKMAGKQQGGFVSPSVLANMAAAQVGGVTGWMSAEDDASFAERLSLAGMGALAGIGMKVGASKVLKSHEMDILSNPHPVVEKLASKELANIAPITEAAKKPSPVIHMDKVKELVQAAREGRLEEVSKTASKDAINFTRVDSDADVEELFNAVQATFQKEMEKASGGAVRSHELVKKNAELTGSGLKSIEERYQKVANLDSQVLADRQLLQASAEKARELMNLAVSTGDDMAVLAAEKQLKLHAVIQAKVAGARTEIARALAAMRITASSADLAINEASSLIESLGGKTAKLDFFKGLQDIPTDEGLNKAIRLGAMARTRDALTEATVMGKLWSPITHAANFVGNTLTAIGGLAEKSTASLIGKYITHSADAVQSGEVKSQMFGMIGGIADALHITKQGMSALKEAAGESLQGNFKAAGGVLMDNIEEFGDSYRAALTDAPVGRSTINQTMDHNQGMVNAISSQAFGLDGEKPLGMLVDALGTLNRLPGRALGASDELFWAINYRGELRAQAYRTARQEGLEGTELVNRIADLVENPTVEARAVAVKSAQSGTFTEPLTGFGKDLQKWVDAANVGGVPVGRIIMPFVKTPYNIMKYAAERTPAVSMATDSWKADMLAGGYRRDMALARVTTGSFLLMMGGVLATGMEFGDTEVKIVGGGDLKRGAENLNGQQAYSLKVGDKYYSFNRLDPVGMFLGLVADFRDISGNVDEATMGELTAAATLSLSRNIASKSYLSGLVDLTTALSDAAKGNTKALERYLYNQTAGMIPASTLFNTVRKEDDPMTREVWSFMDAVKNKLPGYSKDLPPVRNVFGEPVKTSGGLGSDTISPIRTSEANTDPLASEIARLNIDLQKPSKTLFTAPGAKGLDLSPDQYDDLVKVSGEWFKERLRETINHERYKGLSEGNPDYLDGKEKVIRDLYARAKMYGTKHVLSQHPELSERWHDEKRKASNALSGVLQ